MNGHEILFLGALAFALATGTLLGCWLLGFALRREHQRVRTVVSQVERDMRLNALTLQEARSRLDTLERHSRTLEDAQRHLESRGHGPVNYGQAISLVKRGWRTDDLVSSCGLTRGEAELVYLLHGPGGAMSIHRTNKNYSS